MNSVNLNFGIHFGTSLMLEPGANGLPAPRNAIARTHGARVHGEVIQKRKTLSY
jgi:hypothetical protein